MRELIYKAITGADPVNRGWIRVTFPAFPCNVCTGSDLSTALKYARRLLERTVYTMKQTGIPLPACDRIDPNGKNVYIVIYPDYPTDETKEYFLTRYAESEDTDKMKFAKDIAEEIKKRGPIVVHDGSVTGEPHARYMRRVKEDRALKHFIDSDQKLGINLDKMSDWIVFDEEDENTYPPIQAIIWATIIPYRKNEPNVYLMRRIGGNIDHYFLIELERGGAVAKNGGFLATTPIAWKLFVPEVPYVKPEEDIKIGFSIKKPSIPIVEKDSIRPIIVERDTVPFPLEFRFIINDDGTRCALPPNIIKSIDTPTIDFNKIFMYQFQDGVCGGLVYADSEENAIEVLSGNSDDPNFVGLLRACNAITPFNSLIDQLIDSKDHKINLW